VTEHQTTNLGALKPSPLMGEDWVGVVFDKGPSVSADSTPLRPLPIKGRGI